MTLREKSVEFVVTIVKEVLSIDRKFRAIVCQIILFATESFAIIKGFRYDESLLNGRSVIENGLSELETLWEWIYKWDLLFLSAYVLSDAGAIKIFIYLRYVT